MIAVPSRTSASSCSGRTFDGPQPKRPSAGSNSRGIWRVVVGTVPKLVDPSPEGRYGHIMRAALLTILTTTAILITAAASPAASSCGAVNGGFENTIKASGVSCTKAKSIVKKWHVKAVDQGQGPGGTKYVGMFTCISHGAGDPEHVVVNCADGTKKIRFFAGP